MKLDTNHSPPYTYIRVERPPDWNWIATLPGLLAVNLHPFASGPEVELVFGGDHLSEEALGAAVEAAMHRPVLASKRGVE